MSRVEVTGEIITGVSLGFEVIFADDDDPYTYVILDFLLVRVLLSIEQSI